jgi:hypothetical protein
MLSTYLAIFDSVRQAGKGDKEQDGKGKPPYKLQVGYRVQAVLMRTASKA